MANIKPVRTEVAYEAALASIDPAEGDEIDDLADLVALDERKHIQMKNPSPIAAIKFCMEQEGLSQRDLIPFIGSRPAVSEVLSGKRAITMPMAKMLHKHLWIPADVLLREPSGVLDDPRGSIEWHRFPLKAMVKNGWIPDGPKLSVRAEELISDLIERAGGAGGTGVGLYRKNDQVRASAKMDPYALQALVLAGSCGSKQERAEGEL